jgi:N-acetyl-anhydromuramyl-L-alanine amidase AmpD
MANMRSVGISLVNTMPNLTKKPNSPMYPLTHPRFAEMQKHPRPLSDLVEINGARVQSFGYTEAQWRSVLSVSRLLLRVFPTVKPDVPRRENGSVFNRALEEPLTFSGFIGHHHVEIERWDPGPGFDWERLVRALRPETEP